MTNEWVVVAKEALKIPSLIVEIYGDVAKPGVKQVGKALDTVLGLGNTLLWPVYLVNEKSKLSIQKNLESYRKKLENIPEDKIINVAPEIGVPIAEKLSYVSDESISNLYVTFLLKLLVLSMCIMRTQVLLM